MSLRRVPGWNSIQYHGYQTTDAREVVQGVAAALGCHVQLSTFPDRKVLIFRLTDMDGQVAPADAFGAVRSEWAKLAYLRATEPKALPHALFRIRHGYRRVGHMVEVDLRGVFTSTSVDVDTVAHDTARELGVPLIGVSEYQGQILAQLSRADADFPRVLRERLLEAQNIMASHRRDKGVHVVNAGGTNFITTGGTQINAVHGSSNEVSYTHEHREILNVIRQEIETNSTLRDEDRKQLHDAIQKVETSPSPAAANRLLVLLSKAIPIAGRLAEVIPKLAEMAQGGG